jgi:hypothetical protein
MERLVREPIQVYLDARDRGMLDALAERVSVPRAEILRLALRRMSGDLMGRDRAGASMSALVGVLDGSPDIPADLSVRHDEYLHADDAQPPKRRTKR